MWRLILLTGLFLGASNSMAQTAPLCSPERELSQAAEALLSAKSNPDAEAIARAARAAGSDVVSIRALWQEGADREKVRQWLNTFRGQADSPLVCGAATRSNLSLTIAAARGGGLHPIAPGARSVRGWLARGFSRPQLVLIDATGRLVHYELTVEELSLGASITADIALPARVQLVARGPGGPRPIAERIIPKGKYTQVSSPGGDRFAVLSPTETDAFNHLSQIRSAWGSPPVRKNRLLAQVATTHARAICETGRIAHELRAGDDPEKRLKQAGIQARGVGEALAHGESVFAAMAALQRSPSHLMTLIDRRFTDGAVGVSTDRDSKPCVVVLLAIWPRVIGNAAP